MGSFKPNQRTIEQFLLNLMRGWNSEETLEVRCIGENSRPHSMRFKPDKYLDAVQYIVAKNNTNNVYVCVNPVPSTIQGSAKDKDIKRSFFAFVDGDEKGAADRARECDWFDIAMEVVTGVKPHFRNHIYYRFDNPLEDMLQWTELQKLLSAYLNTDKVIHNPSRIMRVAGTVTYPHKKKQALGYSSELTRLIIGGNHVE